MENPTSPAGAGSTKPLSFLCQHIHVSASISCPLVPVGLSLSWQNAWCFQVISVPEISWGGPTHLHLSPTTYLERQATYSTGAWYSRITCQSQCKARMWKSHPSVRLVWSSRLRCERVQHAKFCCTRWDHFSRFKVLRMSTQSKILTYWNSEAKWLVTISFQGSLKGRLQLVSSSVSNLAS